MKKIISATAVILIIGLSGCGKNDSDKVNARSPSGLKAEKIVTRWKEPGLKSTGYGIIVEQEGRKVSATLYRVEPGEGFVIKEKASDGKFYPGKNEIVFPLFMQGVFSVDDWVAAGGSHVVVPMDRPGSSLIEATNLVGELKDMAHKATYTFVRLPGESLPSSLNSSSVNSPARSAP
jgi:hypothetical protein